jgi:hypothetical protein
MAVLLRALCGKALCGGLTYLDAGRRGKVTER